MSDLLLISDLFPFLTSFLFVFAIVFGLLSIMKRGTEGKKEVFFPKNVNIIIALVFGFIAASYQPFVVFVQEIIPAATIILVVVFFFIFLKEIITPKKERDTTPLIVSLGIFLLLIGSFWNKVSIHLKFISSTDLLWMIGIVVVAIMFYAAYTSTSGRGGTTQTPVQQPG